MRAPCAPLLLLALSAAAAPLAAAETPPPAAKKSPAFQEKVTQEDRDKDGRQETTIYQTGSQIRRIEVDKNGDGRTDQWVDFAGGKRSKGENDSDFDGKPDGWYVYSREGALRFAMRDSNKDGQPDEFKTMVKGRELVLREMDTNYDGKVDKRRLQKWGMVRSVPGQPGIPSYVTVMREEDLDFDGIIDSYAEKTEKGSKAKPSRLGQRIKTEPNYPMPEEAEPAASSGGGSSVDPATGKRRPGEAAGGRWKSGDQLTKEMNERYGLE